MPSVSVSVSVSVFLCFLIFVLLCSVCGDDSKFYDCSHIHWICFRYINSQHCVLLCRCRRQFQKAKIPWEIIFIAIAHTSFLDSLSAHLLSGVVCAVLCGSRCHFFLGCFRIYLRYMCVNILCRNQYLNEISGNEMGNTAPAQWIIWLENQTNAIRIHLFISCICSSVCVWRVRCRKKGKQPFRLICVEFFASPKWKTKKLEVLRPQNK